MNNEQKEKQAMAQEVGKLLPETIEKTEHYKDVLKAEAGLMNKLISRQEKWWVSSVKKLKEQIEILNLKNSLTNKQKIYESYLARKKKHEGWLDEMAREVSENFSTTLSDAKAITTNVRLMNSIQSYEDQEATRPHGTQAKVEFYLYLQQEIENSRKHSKIKNKSNIKKVN